MRVHLLCVGDLKGSLRSAVAEYEERIGRYWRFQLSEVEAGIGKARKVTEGKVRAAEEERLLARIPKGGGELVALTREGKALGSRELADFMAEQALRSVQDVIFVIGGAFGLGKGILERSTLKLSVSPMTLPHEIARLLLVEQLYRAGTILRNEPYHKGP
ncbi:MAG: 23S rRNA (pseudouridine(1915)-N(3))-methyltransferase RlmH [Longimicrobiales bacterium]|nr:23S rRNA (pseudouridine(1915)-N(3))-methyltransferase RlmH [Longimicrobiales bacterium]